MAVNAKGGGGGAAGSIRAGKAHVEMSLEDSGLTSGLRKLQKDILGFGKSLMTGGSALLGSATALLAPLAGIFTKTIGHYDDIKKASDRLGESAETVSALGYAAGQSGSDLEKLEASARKMQKTLVDAADGGKEAQEAFGQLGLSADKLMELPLDEQLAMIADALGTVPEGANRAAQAMKIFGKSGTDMLPLLNGGGKGIKALMEEAKSVGAVVSGEDAAKAERAGDAIDRAWTAAKSTIMRVGAAFLPQIATIERLSATVVSGIARIREFIDENQEIIVAVTAAALAVGGLGAAFIAAGATLSVISMAISGFMAIPSALAAAASGLLGLGGFLGSVLVALPAIAAVVIAIAKGLAVVAAMGAGAAAAVAAVAGAAYLLTGRNFGGELLDGVKDFGGQALDYLVGLGQSIYDKVAEVLGTIFRPLISSWQSVREAIAAGDLQGAFRVTVAALKASWSEVLVYFQQAWNEVEGFFVDSWEDIAFEVESVWEIIKFVAAAIGDEMAPEIEFVKKVWSGFVDAVVLTAKVIAGVLYVAFVVPFENMLKLVARAARAIGKSELAASIENTLTGAVDSVKEMISGIQEEANRGTKDKLDQLRREKDLRKEIAAKEREAALAKRKEDRDALNAARLLAELELKSLEARQLVPGVASAVLGAVRPVGVAGLAAQIAAGRATSALGSFSARNAQQALGSGGVTDKIEKNTKRAADAGEDVAKKIDGLRMEFA